MSEPRPVPPARAARIAAGYGGGEGLARLAALVGVSASRLRDFEARRDTPREAVAFALARALSCRPDVFLISRPEPGAGNPGRSQAPRREAPGKNKGRSAARTR